MDDNVAEVLDDPTRGVGAYNAGCPDPELTQMALNPVTQSAKLERRVTGGDYEDIGEVANPLHVKDFNVQGLVFVGQSCDSDGFILRFQKYSFPLSKGFFFADSPMHAFERTAGSRMESFASPRYVIGFVKDRRVDGGVQVLPCQPA